MVFTPLDHDTDGKRGDNPSAVGSDDLLEEVNHLNLFVGVALNMSVPFTDHSALVLLVSLIRLP